MGSQAEFLPLSQVRESRHFGRDAEIQAMDGKKSVVQMLDLGNVPTRSFMFAVAGTSVVALSLPSLDGNFPITQVFDLGNVPARSFTSL